MVDTNKILTVSYGTFSCTLEGFDDSFGTMKAIAEYFRDLAADDRYFGAEPPTPDAEMLARIAEKEIARRVEARMEENSIVLRADHGSILPVAAAAVQDAAQEPAKTQAETKVETQVETPDEARTEPAEPENEAPVQSQPQAERSQPEAPKAEPATDAPSAPVAPVSEDDLTVQNSQPTAFQAPLEAAPAEGTPIAMAMAPVNLTQDAPAAAPLADMPAQDQTTEVEDEAEAETDTDIAIDAVQTDAPADSPVKAHEEELYDDDSGDITGDVSGEFAPQAFANPAEAAISDEPADSVAAKLRRIRAVVSQSADPLLAEDEHADDFLADTNEELEAALAIDDEAELASDAPAEDANDTTDGDIAALLDRFGADEPVETEAPADVAEALITPPPADAIAEDHSDDTDTDLDDDLAVDDSNDALFDPEEFIAADDGADDTFDADDSLDTSAEAPVIGEHLAPAEEPEKTGSIRARIIKMKRSVFNAAIASGDLEEEAEVARDDPAADTSLSAEEEAELRDELAAVEAELELPQDDQAADLTGFEDDYEEIDGDDDLSERLHGLLNPEGGDAAEADDSADDYAPVADLDGSLDADAGLDTGTDTGHDDSLAAADGGDDNGDNIFGAADDDGLDENDYAAEQGQQGAQNAFKADAEDEMGRIFAEADNQMDEETGKGRRNAIAHLRAAVAAAKAEESAGKSLNDKGPDTVAYRDDLESVVRPRRPEAVKTRTRRPEPSRPAPLKLVAEQRVDVTETAAQEPVRPRRVDMADTGVSEEPVAEGEFADYAESVGANSLPELLEAAAAYLSFVEGREQFSRPQLMTQVRKVEKDEFSREDGLRSFGQLLREGKIEKLEGGRFKASESISYRPDARYAGE
ncbi:hypothetical protein N4R57_01130 [Rhodobacteraceae bacterium D3-12]|nr:hypothetical protein N4R57_01130 [Rhodobacteraceae bacterium D3-12]